MNATPTAERARNPFEEGLKTRWLSLVERYVTENVATWVATHGEARAKRIVTAFIAAVKSPGYWDDIFTFIEAHKVEMARRYDPAVVSPQAIAELHAFIRSKHADAFR